MKQNIGNKVIIDLAKTSPFLFTIGIIATILSSAIVLSFGKIVRDIVNIGSNGDIVGLHNKICIFIGIAVLMCIFSFLRSFTMNLVAEKFCNNKKLMIYSKVLHSNVESIYGIGINKIIGMLSGDFKQVRTIIGTSFPFVIRGSITLIGGLFIIFYMSPFLSSIILGVIGLIIIPLIFFGKKLRKDKKNMQNIIDECDKSIFDTILYIKKVKSNVMENIEYQSIANRITNIFILEKIRLLLRSCFISLCILALIVAVSIAMFYGFREVNLGIISSGEMTAFIIYAIMIAFGAGGLAEHGADFSNLTKAMINIENVENNLIPEYFVNTKLKIQENVEIIVQDFEIHINNKTIKIPKFTANSNDVIIFNSKSGSGKSTFFDILLKFRNLESGKIKIFGDDITNIDAKKIRQYITYSLQDSVVFHRSLLENLQYGNNANLNEVIKIMQEIGLDNLISRINDKVENINLSGGEKRRISIISSLLNKNAKIIVLDEPTNGLDIANIEKTFVVINQYSQYKILLIASHNVQIHDLFKNRITKLISIL